MNRRQFFGSFVSVPIAASLVIPELTRTIFLPPRGGWWVDHQNVIYTMAQMREDLIDAIYAVDPFKTPMFNMARSRLITAEDVWQVYPSPCLLDAP